MTLLAALAAGCGSSDDGPSASDRQAVEVFVSDVAHELAIGIGLSSGSTPSEDFSGFPIRCSVEGWLSLGCHTQAGSGRYEFEFVDCINFVDPFPAPGDDQVWTAGVIGVVTPNETCSFPYPSRGPGPRELRYDADRQFRDGAGEPLWDLSILLESAYEFDDAGVAFSKLDADVAPSCSEPMTAHLLDELRQLPPRCRVTTEFVDGEFVVTEECDGPRECTLVGSFEVETSGGAHLVHYSAEDITIDFGADGSIDEVLDDCLTDGLATCDPRDPEPTPSS